MNKFYIHIPFKSLYTNHATTPPLHVYLKINKTNFISLVNFNTSPSGFLGFMKEL